MSRAMTEGDVGPCMTILLQKKIVDNLCALGQSDVRHIPGCMLCPSHHPSPPCVPTATDRYDGAHHQHSPRAPRCYKTGLARSSCPDHGSDQQAGPGELTLASVVSLTRTCSYSQLQVPRTKRMCHPG